MKEVLYSMCGGNRRGYKGTKEELPMIISKSREFCLEMNGDMGDIDYIGRNLARLKPESDGLYEVTFWSKW